MSWTRAFSTGSQQPAGGGSRRAQAADQSGARIQDAADGIGDDQGLRGHADDPLAAMPDAPVRLDGRSAFCEPAIPSRRLIRQDGRGKLRVRLTNATERRKSAMVLKSGFRLPLVLHRLGNMPPMTDRSGVVIVRSNGKPVSHVLRRIARWAGLRSFPMQGMLSGPQRM